jgi:hypothetical protein
MPEQRVFQDLVPRPDAGDGGIDQHEACDACGIERGEGIADHVADVVGHEVGALDLELIENTGHIERLRLLVETAGRLGRQAQSAQIGDQDGMIAREVGGHRRPHVAGLAITVQQNDGRPRSARAHVDRGAIGRHVAGDKSGWKLEHRRDLSGHCWIHASLAPREK